MKTVASRMSWCLGLLLLVSLAGYPGGVWGGEGGSCTLVVDNSLPAVTGTLIFEKKTDDYGMATFTGFCGSKLVYKKFCYPILKVEGFAAIQKEDLEHMPPFSDIGPPECATDCGGEQMVITRVSRFVNTGRKIFATITFQYGSCE